MTLIHSNHSSLIFRRALKHGMPKAYLKNYNEFLGVGKGWNWVEDLNLELSDGSECFFTHGISADGLKLAMQYGKNTCQGHFHSKFQIQYFSNPDALVWSMQVGCLANMKHMAFNYARTFRLRFILGIGVIISGQPKITINKNKFFKNPNESVFIPRGAIHRIENPFNKPVQIVEVQTGSILKETDITRYKDIYGRVN